MGARGQITANDERGLPGDRMSAAGSGGTIFFGRDLPGFNECAHGMRSLGLCCLPGRCGLADDVVHRGAVGAHRAIGVGVARTGVQGGAGGIETIGTQTDTAGIGMIQMRIHGTGPFAFFSSSGHLARNCCKTLMRSVLNTKVRYVP